MSRIARLLLVILSLLLAPFLLLQGQANAGNPSSPLYATNGYNLADLATASMRVEAVGNSVAIEVGEPGITAARRAFAREPLASDALFVLALDARSNGDSETMDALLDGANRLDKRNRNIGALQIEQAVLTGDLDGTFAIVDRLATVHPRLTSDFVQPLVGALAEDGAIEILGDALEDEPVWAEAFWGAVPGDPQLVARMYELRQRVSIGTTARTDALLLAGLVRLERYGEAFAFWQEVVPGDKADTGYVSTTDFPPFGWEVVASADHSMSPRGEASFDVYVQNETSGRIGRQLLRLVPGQYRFDANVTPVGNAADIAASLICADDDSIAGASLSLDGDVVWTVSGGCEAYWLQLTGSAWDRRDPMRATISDMRFQAAS